jgi:hypothetical protein
MDRSRLIISVGVAFFVTAIRVAHKKIGGLLSGGNYSDSHSWVEILKMTPSFIFYFLLVFLFVYWLQSSKK